ncbi:AIM14 [[Candida] subhashii]|uniref:Probable metalloreductase AIM14 n=1 Tax=[Candida] subhashii TaxID=561895 RepID=A0A8J5ULA8_9ASCO|nr:AIM14 [[Candida] subhashii]KAG7662701.1 AIM14 [[Candida] subhashii]
MNDNNIHMLNDVNRLQPRHGDHHYINVKYGYFIFGLSLVHIFYRTILKYVYVKRWISTGTHSRLLRRYSSIPTWLIVSVWFLIIFFVGGFHIDDFSEEYIVSAKRFGRIAYCLIPLNIFLILRPTDVRLWKIGYYIENLNLHKWISRLIAFCVAIHSVGYFYKWITEGTILSKPFEILNLLGVIVFILFAILIVLSIRSMRRRNYVLFYVLHNITAWSMVLLIALHARPGVTIFAFVNMALLCYQLYLRYYASYKVDTLKVIEKPTSTLRIVKINQPDNFKSWLPASHIRLNYSMSNIRSWTNATHPFTLANISDDNNNLILIVKKTSFVFDPMQSYLLTGPYPALPSPFFNSAKLVNIVCGGSGISFALPIYRYFKVCNPNATVKLVWCIRNKVDTFIIHQLDIEGIQVFITSTIGQDSPVSSSPSTPSNSSFEPIEQVVDDEHTQGLLQDGEDGIELQELKNDDNNEPPTVEKSASTTFHVGRPKLDEVFAIEDPTLVEDKRNSWVIACGPDTLIADAKEWSKEHEYQFYFEKYEM